MLAAGNVDDLDLCMALLGKPFREDLLPGPEKGERRQRVGQGKFDFVLLIQQAISADSCVECQCSEVWPVPYTNLGYKASILRLEGLGGMEGELEDSHDTLDDRKSR